MTPTTNQNTFLAQELLTQELFEIFNSLLSNSHAFTYCIGYAFFILNGCKSLTLLFRLDILL